MSRPDAVRFAGWFDLCPPFHSSFCVLFRVDISTLVTYTEGWAAAYAIRSTREDCAMMLATFQQVLKLFFFLAIGFFLRRSSVIPRSTSGTLSLLEVNLFIPCLNFLTFARNFTLEKLSSAGELMIASVISVLLSCAVGTLVGRKLSRDPYRQNVCVYSINMPNTGYVGTPLVLALFGSEVLMQMGLFCLPFSIYTYTEGYRLLLDRKGFSFRSLLNPSLLAIFAGILFGMFRIPLPEVVVEVFEDCGNCMDRWPCC